MRSGIDGVAMRGGWRGGLVTMGWLMMLAAQASAPAHAQDLQWHCWVDTAQRLRCVLNGTATSTDPLTTTPGGTGGGATAPRITFQTPAGTRTLPPLVSQLRDQPGSLAGQMVMIPLFAITDDWPWVRELAQSVLCSSGQRCSVRLSPSLSDALANGLDTDQLFIGPDLGMVMPGLR